MTDTDRDLIAEVKRALAEYDAGTLDFCSHATLCEHFDDARKRLAALVARVEAAEQERDALRARVAELEADVAHLEWRLGENVAP